MADELLDLVLGRTKTATTGALWEYEAEDERVPAPGQLSIILDGNGAPACVIDTTEGRVMAMADVDSQVACDEGERDRTLEYWRAAHERFFGRTLTRLVASSTLRRPSLHASVQPQGVQAAANPHRLLIHID